MRYVTLSKTTSLHFENRTPIRCGGDVLWLEFETDGNNSHICFPDNLNHSTWVPTEYLHVSDTYYVTADEDNYILASGESPGVCHKKLSSEMGDLWVNNIEDTGNNSYEIEFCNQDGKLCHFWLYVNKPEPEPKARVTYDYDPDTGIMKMNFYNNKDDKTPVFRETVTDPDTVAQLRARIAKYRQ